MSAYNSVLHLDHDLPVISILVYPFKTTMVASPFVVKGGDGVINTFHFHVIPLFLLDAEHYVREHIVCMYPLLAVMKGANRRLLKEAIEELAQVYRHDQETLGDFFAYMVVLLERSSTMTRSEKQKAKEELNVYNSLWDQSPIIQQMRAASKEEGKVEGEVEALQKTVVNIVKARFPLLADLAQQRAMQLNDIEKLDNLIVQISMTPDEASIRLLLAPTVA